MGDGDGGPAGEDRAATTGSARQPADDGEPADEVSHEETELDPLSLDEAVSILGEETRARIIVELGDAWGSAGPGPEYLSFSELMERVGAEDSGRFNYHLDKLVGTFVAKSDDGYAVRQPGKAVHAAIVAGTFTDRDRVEALPVDDCPSCDGELTATYRSDQILAVSCRNCGEFGTAFTLSPRAVEGRSGDELVDVAAKQVYHDVGLCRRGVCHACGGRVERDLAATVPDVWPDQIDYDVFATMSCADCGESTIAHPAEIAVMAPAVAAFLADHGRDPALVRSWEPAVRDARERTSVESGSPTEVAIGYELDGDRLGVVLDDDLRVVESERTDR